ncbi:MAG: tol-pal system-associated acyl-CoA thioesterase [Methylococcales symbiont of Iophon sp. n. MRB-2018]|nr:MAG: tol-pal system-associated acyl-CoA thioesterase [Methylococcales symbiont of Iophon sp. n. MRB-2018]KAF3980193.1 MAG: tol-pal system-associated acyl-CoA thioesterase [Methylococcales symbiont of Iophon sp. n. MRB-2018]
MVFHWPIRVYYEDTDAGGIVFYANYLKFFERARTEMLRELGFEQDQLRSEQNLIFAVRSVQIDYLKSGHFNELLNISAEITLLKKASLNFEQIASLDGTALCRANVRIACLQADTMIPKKIPAFILQKLHND